LVFSLLYRRLRLSYRQRLQLEQRLQVISELQLVDHPLLDERLRLPFSQRVFQPLLRSFGSRLQRLAPSAVRQSSERKLAMAGLQLTAEQWSGYYVLASGSGLLLGALLGSLGSNAAIASVTFGLIGLLFGAYLPRLLLSQAITRRQKAILRALPDVLDLLTVSVKAGLGFDSALLRVTEKMNGPLPQELAQVLHEIKVGVLRKDALKSLAERTGVSELQGFVGTIIQADQLGVSISNVLQLQAESLRERRRQVAEEQAMKAPVKMLFPLILFIFPTLFIVLLGPALIQVVTNLAGM
jgi:tight adherence protein C